MGKKRQPQTQDGGNHSDNARTSESPQVQIPSAEQVRDTWLKAVQEEDAASAQECARWCESMRGAEIFAETDGMDAFLAVAMGQSMKDGDQAAGVMKALAQAMMRSMEAFHLAVFGALAAAAQWPQLRGRIAGSGVLGVVTATLLAPCQNATTKALMARLAGLMVVDVPETKLLGDARREEEFAKLRGQLISAGALKQIAAMVRTGANTAGCLAAGPAIAALAGVGGDATSRQALADARATYALLSRVPGWTGGEDDVDDGRADAKPVPNMFEGKVDNDDSDSAASAPAVSVPSPSQVEDDASKMDESSCLASNLRAIATIAATDGTGMKELWTPLSEPLAISQLRVLVAEGEQEIAIQALSCLVAFGRRAGPLETCCGPFRPVAVNLADNGLADVVAKLVRRGGNATLSAAISALLADRARAARLGDLRDLRQAVQEAATLSVGSRGPICAVKDALGTLKGCDHCGSVPETALSLCAACKVAAYCSHACQKAAWKAGHKAKCASAKKN